MNACSLIGRITKDLEIRNTQSNKSVLAFTLAVNRRLTQEQKNAGAQSADFINCVVWNQPAEYLARYAGKGAMISLSGRIATRSYDGQYGKVYVTEVIGDEVSILNTPKKEENQQKEEKQPQQSGYRFNEVAREATDFQMNLGGDTDVLGYSTVPTINSDDLPFY